MLDVLRGQFYLWNHESHQLAIGEFFHDRPAYVQYPLIVTVLGPRYWYNRVSSWPLHILSGAFVQKILIKPMFVGMVRGKDRICHISPLPWPSCS